MQIYSFKFIIIKSESDYAHYFIMNHKNQWKSIIMNLCSLLENSKSIYRF